MKVVDVSISRVSIQAQAPAEFYRVKWKGRFAEFAIPEGHWIVKGTEDGVSMCEMQGPEIQARLEPWAPGHMD